LPIGSNLPPKDNLRKEDKSSAPIVLLPKCPLFGGSTVDPTDMYLVIDVANIELHDVFHKYCISSELFTVVRIRSCHIVELAI